MFVSCCIVQFGNSHEERLHELRCKQLRKLINILTRFSQPAIPRFSGSADSQTPSLSGAVIGRAVVDVLIGRLSVSFPLRPVHIVCLFVCTMEDWGWGEGRL